MQAPINALKCALPLSLLLAPSLAGAQVVPGTPYQVIRSANTYTPLSNPTTIWTNVDDDTDQISLPFSIRFYDTMQSSIAVGSNGIIAVPGGVNTTRFNNAPGSTGAPSGFVAPFWDDLLLDAGTDHIIGYQVEGTAPTRTLTVEWRNIGFYNFAGQIGEMSFQVRFYEGVSGRIDIDYGPKTGTFNGTVTMGMENPANGGAILFANGGCTSNCTYADFAANTRVTVVQDPGVELVAAGVQPPAFAFLGAQTVIPVIVQNLHGNPVGPFDVEVVVSPTSDLANAVGIGSASVTLPAFTTQTVDVLTVPPTGLGTNPVYVGLIVDANGAIAEAEEANNTAVSTDRMRLLMGLPDLAVDRVRSTPSRIDAGDTIDVVAIVKNVGSDPVPSTEVAIILSTNVVISRQDVKLGSVNVALQPGETTEINTTVTVPAATNSGSYWVGALADPMDTVNELSESNNGVADISPIEITGGSLTLTTTVLPDALVGRAYNAAISVTGGDPNDRTWSISRGALPAGIGISPATGELFGRGAVVETQTFTVQLVSGGETATQELTLAVVDPSEPLTIVTRDIPNAVVGQEYRFQLLATGGTNPNQRTWLSTDLPAGLELTADGVLAGTPTMVGTNDFSVAVNDGVEMSIANYTLDVSESPNLLIVPRVLSTARFGEPYEEQLEASGGVGEILWLVQAGSLPPGLTLSPTGVISGTPERVGRFTFVVGARDTTVGLLASDSNSFEITVLDAEGFEILTSMLPTGFVGEGYETTIEANGGLPPYTWEIIEGRLPEGLLGVVDDGTGTFRIAGQPVSMEVSNVIVEVTDAQGRQAVRAFGLRIDDPPDVIEDPAGGCSCDATAPARRGPSWLLLFALVGFLFRGPWDRSRNA